MSEWLVVLKESPSLLVTQVEDEDGERQRKDTSHNNTGKADVTDAVEV